MKQVWGIFAAYALAAAPAFGASHGFVANLSPVADAAGSIEIPAKDNCTSEGTNLRITSCETPGAAIAFAGSGTRITLTEYKKITSYHGGVRYDEVLLNGAAELNGGSVATQVRVVYKGGVAFPATLTYLKSQSFVMVLDDTTTLL